MDRIEVIELIEPKCIAKKSAQDLIDRAEADHRHKADDGFVVTEDAFTVFQALSTVNGRFVTSVEFGFGENDIGNATQNQWRHGQINSFKQIDSFLT